jgi:hypothetical protein
MTDILILQLITTITVYCSGSGNLGNSPEIRRGETLCFQKIWKCGHKVSSPIAIVTETHNCVTKHINGELK